MKDKTTTRNYRTLIRRFIIVLLIVGCCLCAIGLYNQYKINKAAEEEYNYLVSMYDELDASLNNNGILIKDLNAKEIEQEDRLYQAIVTFYENNADSMEAFKRVYEQSYPSEEEFKSNRRDSFVKIYALLSIYADEFEHDENIDMCVSNITESITNLQGTIREYRESLVEYNEVVDIINECAYVNRHNECYITPGRYSDILVME